MKSIQFIRLVTLVIGSMIVLAFGTTLAQQDAKKNYVSTDTILVVGERDAKIPTTNTIATKLPVPLRLTPASIGVVTNALLENQDAIVLGDALRNVSGINSQTGFGVFDFFIIRGFESLSNGLVLTDGAAEPEVTYYNMYNIERVEVLKGPSAFLYGANPLSGTVNLVRKQPVFSKFLYATGSYGEFNSYRGTVDVGLADANSRTAFRLNGLWQKSENYRDDKKNDNISVNPALTWRLNDKTLLTANLEYVKSEYKPDSGLPLLNNQIPNVPRTQSYQLPSDISDQKVLRGRLDFETRLSDHFTLRNKFYYTDLDWKSDGTLLLGAFTIPQAGDLVGRVMNALDDRQKLVGNQLEGMLHFNTGSVRHQILAGLEVSRLGDEFTLGAAVPPPISLYSPQESATAVSASPFLINDARSLTMAPYLLDQIAFSEKLQAFAGGRFDVIDYEDTHSSPGLQGLVTSSTTRDDQKFSPLLGLVYSPTRELSFYANAGQAFGPPSTLIVENLEAEESQQIEAGVKTQFFDGKLNAGLAAYQLEKNNLIIPDFSGLRYLSGEQRSRGIEFDLAAQPSPSWQAFVTYAFNDAELTNFSEDVFVPPAGPVVRVDHSGNTPAFAPKHILNVWTNKVFANRLGLGLGGRYLSEQFIDEDNVFKIDGIFLVDAMLYYNIGNWRWTLNAKNLTDAKYETRAFGSGSILPGNPLAIYGGIEFRL